MNLQLLQKSHLPPVRLSSAVVGSYTDGDGLRTRSSTMGQRLCIILSGSF
jgi:hypothetical protein